MTKAHQCKCESWCYCSRPSIQKEIDKIPFIDSEDIIKQRIHFWKETSASKYSFEIGNFIYNRRYS
jgi:hypothetical protein